jgi:hypothetical protein
MKVVRTGVLTWFNGHAHLNGWAVDWEGRSAEPRAALQAVLIHIASAHGIQLVPGTDAPPRSLRLGQRARGARCDRNGALARQ